MRSASSAVFGELHRQLGPTFRAVSLSMCGDKERSLVESAFERNSFDPLACKEERTRRCVILNIGVGSSGQSSSDQGLGVDIEIPRTDLVEQIGKDCVAKLVSIHVMVQQKHFPGWSSYSVLGIERGQDCLETEEGSIG